MPLIEINKKQGVVLLYAVLMVSIVLTISLSLLNITYKQIVLTAVSRESQVAHFTALSALDCISSTNRSYRIPGLLNEQTNNPFGVFSFFPTTLSQPISPQETFSCGSGVSQITANVITAAGPVSSIGLSAQGILSRFKLTGQGLVGSCAIVDVAKVLSGNYADFPSEGSVSDDARETMITALGYNNSSLCDTPPGVSSRLVERQIRKSE